MTYYRRDGTAINCLIGLNFEPLSFGKIFADYLMTLDEEGLLEMSQRVERTSGKLIREL